MLYVENASTGIFQDLLVKACDVCHPQWGVGFRSGVANCRGEGIPGGLEIGGGCLSCYSLIMIKTHRDCFWSLPSYCGSLEERTIKFLLPLLLWTFDNTDPLLLARVLVWWCLRRKCDVSCCRPSVVLLMTNG
ncbi:hypothetical protein RHMOL_Rhmol03G0161500 [Rhododendron molle]|uniref:Uncharacterized protein n=1 Tax=Rhododendron molle TaxID=49168 RepID=A0ACC0PG90_RHOML|nr:hypothetical protein RHMOL_Rhmol03G0161500 [Rhododendron molle]